MRPELGFGPGRGCAIVRVWGSCAKEVGVGLGSGGWNNARAWQLLFKGVPAPVLRGREILAQPHGLDNSYHCPCLVWGLLWLCGCTF